MDGWKSEESLVVSNVCLGLWRAVSFSGSLAIGQLAPHAIIVCGFYVNHSLFFFPPHFLGKRHDCSLPGFGFFLLHLLSPACVWLSWVHLVQVWAVFEKTINPSENSPSFLTRASVLQPLPCEMKVRKNWRKSNRRPNHVQHQSSADALFAWWPAFLDPSQEALREHLDSFVSLFCGSLLWCSWIFIFFYVFRFIIIIFYLLSLHFFCVFPFHPNRSEWVSSLQSQALDGIALSLWTCGTGRFMQGFFFSHKVQGVVCVERITAVRALEKECCSTREHQPRPAKPVHPPSELNWTELKRDATPHSVNTKQTSQWWQTELEQIFIIIIIITANTA